MHARHAGHANARNRAEHGRAAEELKLVTGADRVIELFPHDRTADANHHTHHQRERQCQRHVGPDGPARRDRRVHHEHRRVVHGGEKLTDIKLDRVFIGSCTNGRIEDLRAVAKIAEGKTVNANVYAMIVPGSGLVKEQAEAEGLDKIFKAAGFDWREPGCSMCLAMNPDKLKPGERCASTSNRNFEGRQGHKGRTHLVSPAMAAAAAIAGHFVDIRDWK